VGVAGIERNETTDVALVPVPLTSYPGREWWPSFSPDGNQVVFQWGGRVERAKICVQLVSASEPVCLTNGITPAWSPDGRSIAFEKMGIMDGVFLISCLGGAERKLTELSVGARPPARWPGSAVASRVAWHPDGKWVVVSGTDSVGESSALFAVSTETGEKRRLTSPPAGSSDTLPAVSPDGKAVVFGRNPGGWNVDLYLLELSEGLQPKGEPRRITAENTYCDFPAWTPDGRAIVFVSGTPDIPGLYEMALSGPGWTPGKPRRLAFAGEGVRTPTISRQGRLAYSTFSPNVNIWHLALHGGRPATVRPKRLLTSTRFQHDQEYSPDGKQIAFVSTRSGSHEIWVCDSDGSNAMQLTSLGSSFYTIAPHWSPDGRLILFSSNPEGHDDTYVIAVDGGKPKLLFSNLTVDSWSRDGKWIYFQGDGGVWKRPWPPSEQDAEAVQVTTQGGYLAQESADGRILYYMKDDQELWKIPVKGGEETQVLGSLSCRFFAVVDQGIYFLSGFPQSPKPSIHYLSFATGKTATIATLSGVAWSGFSVSPDGRSLLYAQQEPQEGDLSMVENFR
jgi:Tol biopolymer transport system component